MAGASKFAPIIKATVTGDQRLKATLAAVTDGLLTAAMARRIEELLLKRTKRRFITKTNPAGVPWAALKGSTLDRRSRKVRAGGWNPSAFGIAHYGILVFEGRLADSIRIIRSGRARFATATGAGFRIGTDHPAAKLHQYGDSARNVPARKFLGVTRRDSSAIERLLLRQAKLLGLR